MRPNHMLAAAIIALGGLGLAGPTGAAPAERPGAATEAWGVIQVDHRDGDRHDRGAWRRDRRDWGDDRQWREGRRDDRDDDWRRDRHGEWHGDRGRHLGWERGRGHRWHDHEWKKYKFPAKKHARWHARHHPRHAYWAGRYFPHTRYVVIRDYDDYYLPPPPYGHFYARVDRDVFLVAEGTKRIIDAFVLFDAVGR